MRVIIAEKPSVAQAIASELGGAKRAQGYHACAGGAVAVTWCVGHLLEMAKPDAYDPAYAKWRAEDLPIVPKAWRLIPKADTAPQLAVIGRLVGQASEVVNAGDPDNEGQLLVDEVLQHLGYRGAVLRYWANATDATTVRRALAALERNDQPRYTGMHNAALARQRADWLIGLNMSRAYTLRAQRAGADRLVLPVGRVQSAVLALVVARDRAVDAFKPHPFFVVRAQIAHAAGRFHATWQAPEGQAGLDDDGRLVDAAVASAVCAAARGKTGEVASFTHERKKQAHPLTYSLSDITLEASRRYGYAADAVLEACQALYETHKLTTYPRTDCAHLPEAQHAEAPAVLRALRETAPEFAALIDGATPAIKSATWNDAKVTAHHGIIPTMHRGRLDGLTDPQLNIYRLIVRTYLAQFYPLHEYDRTEVAIRIAGHTFRAAGNTSAVPGWRTVYAPADEAADPASDKDSDQALPRMAQGDPARCDEVEAPSRKTSPPKRFTEGTLIKAMEDIHRYTEDPADKRLLREGEGIGTPATRAGIIGDLRRRALLVAEGKWLKAAPLGCGLVDALDPELKTPSLTALFERVLREIEQGATAVDDFLARQIAFVTEHVAKVRATSAPIAGVVTHACPKCSTGFLRRIPKRAGGFFWGCSRHTDGCDGAFNDVDGKPQTAAPAIACPACRVGKLRRHTTDRGALWACNRRQEGCAFVLPDKNGKPALGTGRR